MNFSNMSYMEVWSICRQAQWEMMIRTWWLIPLAIVVVIILRLIFKNR